MPLTSEKAHLLHRIEIALRSSAWRVLWITHDHPAKARLIRDNNSEPIDVWIHIWNLTLGGRPKKRPLERRIQPTGIEGFFRSSLGFRTLIFGWSEETGVFATFDHRFHKGSFGKSSSFQTDLPALQDAAENGLGVYAKGTGELSIAVRPDLLGLYIEQMKTLHDSGHEPDQLSALRAMAADPLHINPDDLPAPRRRAMTTALRLLRDRRFSERVLSAYHNRCAFCGVQLRLLDAAHILPVAHPESTDEISNGVALCALHHRSYDAALVTFDNSYSIRVSESMIADLEAAGFDGGLSEFKHRLQPALSLPTSVKHYPSLEMVTKANALRGWP